MSGGWHFGKASPEHKAREPQVEKFFGADVVANLANALVREGVQNSLDARDDQRLAPGAPVRVRIRLGEIVAPGLIEDCTTGLWAHLTAQEEDHLPDRPGTALPCPFLAFEDFNTRGLCGNPEQLWADEDPGNHFFNFFRAEGHSEKREDARGRHGLGKHVFARASRARCFFGLTRRADDTRQLFMGAAVLRTHRIGATRYVPDGWFGVRREADGFVLPVESPSAIAAFTQAFGLARDGAVDPGLSVVVPWLDPSINCDDVIDAVLQGYFHPVLAGKLEVTVADPAGEVTIDASSIRAVVEARGPAIKEALSPLLDLAQFSLTVTQSEILQLNAPPSKPVWTAGLLPDDVKTKFRDGLQAMKKIALRVPVKVKTKKPGSAEQLSHFDIFLNRGQGDADGQVVFIRKGLIISDARPRATPGTRALVVISEGPLAAFLGDAENPAHTQWQKSQVESKYTYPDDRIRFVVQSVPKILQFVSAEQQTADPSIWLDLFSIPADKPEFTGPGGIVPGGQRGAGGVKPGGEPPPPPPPPPPPKPRRYRIDKVPGGFVLRRGSPNARRPYAVSINVAYDVRRGNAFKSYTPDDFQLDRDPIKIDARRGAKVTVGQRKNHLLVQITDDDFEVEVSGFGTSRDVITEPRLIPPPDAADDQAIEGAEPATGDALAADSEGLAELEEVLDGDPA